MSGTSEEARPNAGSTPQDPRPIPRADN